MPAPTDNDRESEVESRLALPLRIAVSGVAVAVAVVHVAAPSLKIDATTLVLVGIAALPWLAPILESITFPGGFGVVLRDIHREVKESNRRVEALASDVQQILFQGEQLPAERQDTITKGVRDFARYLERCGLPLPGSPPTVVVREDASPLPYYMPGDNPEIVVRPETPLEDIIRFYTHHVLRSAKGVGEQSFFGTGVQYGLAFYFISRYPEDQEPSFEDALRVPLKDVLAVRRSDGQSFRVGAAWTQLLWGLRDAVSPDELDRALADAWLSADGRDERFDSAYARALLRALSDLGADEGVPVARKHLRDAGLVK